VAENGLTDGECLVLRELRAQPRGAMRNRFSDPRISRPLRVACIAQVFACRQRMAGASRGGVATRTGAQESSDSGQPFEASTGDGKSEGGGRVVPLPSDVEYRCFSGVAACEGVDVVCASCASARASICVFLHLCARVCTRDHACVVCMYL
jgi:hypothetical protein